MADKKINIILDTRATGGATTFFCKIFPNPLDTRRILLYTIEYGN